MSSNPYTPPEAELGAGGPEPPALRIGWKIFFIVLAGLTVLSLPLYVFGVVTTQVADWLGLAVAVLTLVGLGGYAFRRRFGARPFWVAWLPILMVWDFFYYFLLVPRGLAEYDPEPVSAAGFLVGQAAVFAINAAIYIALFRYAHRSPELWSPASPGS